MDKFQSCTTLKSQINTSHAVLFMLLWVGHAAVGGACCQPHPFSQSSLGHLQLLLTRREDRSLLLHMPAHLGQGRLQGSQFTLPAAHARPDQTRPDKTSSSDMARTCNMQGLPDGDFSMEHVGEVSSRGLPLPLN